MPKQILSRRAALQILGTSAALAVVEKAEGHIAPKAVKKPAFTLCLNMATIRGHKLGFVKELETAARAGFHSVEIWIDSLQDYLSNGGSVKKAKRLLDDLGIKVENTISFNEWIVDDPAARKKGMDDMRVEMQMLAELGCKRVAATGKGTTETTVPPYDVIAERYRQILEIGDSTGVVPQLEMWGFQKNLAKVSEVTYIAMESRHPSAKILLDIFHLYRGNTAIETLHLLSPSAVDILHMNDYTANFPYQTITDADRVYPGDGVAPIKKILHTLQKDDHPLVLSTEVFNKIYYQQDPLLVAKTALSRMKAIVGSL